ncbi:hypothetical protein [Lichenibacterium ramalinae]|uniref:Uncharacterized protein n=1 Tax=Lichenibacterium ramalinae TaxID=2316527 RepID=A0A4Q2R630_9HYPH|nr:hypothetical protein [Lichenibacterium ramalinae]RYB02005.1 hypothetical protein D3272_22815 [Lichenibacterium ramalinae]
MSVLLRHPATVPALFSRAMDAERPSEREMRAWRRMASSAPFIAVSGWATVMLIDVPLVKAATLFAGLGFPR